ncbi:hypothetical protein BRD14_00800, partial [Halobacteriales archaeon SW_5_68_122]
MDRRVVVTTAVAAVVLLAGCSMLLGGDGATPAPSPTPEATPTDTPTPVPLEEREFPDGYGPDGVENAETAAGTHVETMTGYDSYRFRFDVRVSSGNGTDDAFVYLTSVDGENGKALELRDDGEVTRYQYYEDDRVYVRVVSGDEEAYNATDQQFGRARLAGNQFLDPLLEYVEYGEAEPVSTDNGTVYRYTSERVTEPGTILSADISEAEIRSFEVELLVHEDGYIRGAKYV